MARPHTIRDGRKPGWFYMDDAVIDRYGPAIGAIGIATYAALARHANSAGQTALAYQTVAGAIKSSRNTVIRTLRKLAEEGLITIESQTDDAGNPIAANVYTLCVIPDQKQAGAHGGVPTVAPPRPTAERGGTHSCTPPDPQLNRGYPQLHGGVPTVAYEGHDPYRDHDHDSPPPTPPTPPSGGGDSDSDRGLTETEAFLLDEQFSGKMAYHFRSLDLGAARQDIRRAKKSGADNGSIIERWKVRPPRPRADLALAAPLHTLDDTHSPEETARRLKQRLAEREHHGKEHPC